MEHINPDEIIVVPSTQELLNNAHARKLELMSEITSLDYLTDKELDGEDMSQYGNWKDNRKLIRKAIRDTNDEILRLEQLLVSENNIDNNLVL